MQISELLHRSYGAIDNVTPSDKYFGRLQEILEHRKKTKNRKSIQINSIIIQVNSIIILYGKNTKKISSPVAAAVENYVLVWSEDSSTIYVASSFAEGPRLDAVDVQTGLSQKIADLDWDLLLGGWRNYYTSGSLAPDGQSLITTARVEKSDLWIHEGVPLPGRQK